MANRCIHQLGSRFTTGRMLYKRNAQYMPRGRAAFTRIISQGGAHISTAPPPATAPTLTPLSGSEIRERFLSFFESKGHRRLPSSSLVPDDPTVLLTIAGMLQFKPVFLGQAARKVLRATTTQKCVRTNDIENVGVTARHHTFFEMLGNFSFGDYFKKEAIQWAWELSTEVFKLPPERVWVSVFEEDDEALQIWRDVVGVPEAQIKRMGAEDNFWASGPTGPCGPCSELYFDFHPERGLEGASLEDDTRFIEFYNLVFMELNRAPDGSLTPLAAKNIDTGLGLERMAQILQGVPNNYEADLIFPIVAKAASLAGVDYHTADAATKTALKVIGDHTRAVAYLISDGVNPSNIGRGYIVRRLLRRVVLKGRLLGIKGVFTPKVAEVAVQLSGGCDPQVAANAQRIYDEMSREESRFVSTLEAGEKQLNEALSRALSGSKVISGPDAFMLYDTFGFPLELTQEVVTAQGVEVDVAGFEAEMEGQRKRSKESRDEVDLTAQGAYGELAKKVAPTEFVGYTEMKTEGSTVVGLFVEGREVEVAEAGSSVDIVLDRTPFYAESGGQVGDRGILEGVSSSGEGVSLEVLDCLKVAGGRLFVHSCQITQGSIKVGQQVDAKVSELRRKRTRAHHTATHLLQSALKNVLGSDTCQQGSLVTADRLRFDFNLSRPMTPTEIAEVESMVNSWVLRSEALVVNEMALDDAKAAGATAMFGEKYDDVVRVVDVPGVSMELCGGTHVQNTAEIGAFKVLSEAGIASGVRRVEAVVGPAAVEHMNALDAVVRSLTSSLKVKPEELPTRLSSLQNELRGAEKKIAELKAQLAVAKSEALASSAERSASGAAVLVAKLEGVDAKALQEAATNLLAKLGDPAAVVLGSTAGEKVNFVAAFSPQVVKSGLLAGKVVGAVAKMCGGGGGGRPNLAQAGGKDASKLDDALTLAKTTILDGLAA